MEADPNPFPTIELFPRVERAARFIKRLFVFNPLEAPAFMSNHYRTPEEAPAQGQLFNPNGGELNDPRDIYVEGEW